jgi:hypothetical protein
MATQNLTTARFVLQSLLQEIEAFDRCIPVARDIQVGDVADALSVFLADRQILRLTAPNVCRANRRRRPAQAAHPAAPKGKPRISCLG